MLRRSPSFSAFTGDTPVSVAYQHVSSALTPASQINPSLDPNLDRMLEVVLAKDPNNRYQDAAAMLEDLEHVIKQASSSVNP